MEESNYDRMMRQATSPEVVANIENYKTHTEKLAAAYHEREKMEKAKFKSDKDAALASLSDKWQPIETAPKGGEVIGLDWFNGFRIANVAWNNEAGHWSMQWCPGYDMYGDELQPVKWMPI